MEKISSLVSSNAEDMVIGTLPLLSVSISTWLTTSPPTFISKDVIQLPMCMTLIFHEYASNKKML